MTISPKTLDHLHNWLRLFTTLYLFAITLEFFSLIHVEYPVLENILDALSEPYLATLGVYVVLKEIQKRKEGRLSIYHGERFVWTWLTLLFLTTVSVLFTDAYRFDTSYRLIVSNSMASLMIYIGSRIHRP